MANKSPLRYAGGKTRACKILLDIFKAKYGATQINTIISPFFGGGSFEFALQDYLDCNVLANDKFKPLMAFWDFAKYDNADLCANIQSLRPMTKTSFLKFRGSIMTEKDRLAQAAEYFTLNRCSYSGTTLSGGFSTDASKTRFNGNAILRVSQLHLDKFAFYCADFANFLGSIAPSDDQLIFADPPYAISNPKLYGKNGDLHENFDHVALHDAIMKFPNWIMTYNDCEYVRNLYADCNIASVGWKYGMNKSKESSEVVITPQ